MLYYSYGNADSTYPARVDPALLILPLLFVVLGLPMLRLEDVNLAVLPVAELGPFAGPAKQEARNISHKQRAIRPEMS